MKGRVLIIAGSDSGGGAGIQADIKTVTALGGYAATAVTAITVQDTKKIHDVVPISPDIIAQQIKVVMDDLGADCIKVGMLGSAKAGEAILSALAPYDVPIVVDPVLVATSGDALGGGDVAAVLKSQMIPKASIVTPNVPELAALTGIPVDDEGSLRTAASSLRSSGARGVMAKAGHLAGDEVRDLYLEGEEVHTYAHPRLVSSNTHGTGCTLASAIATGLAQGMSAPNACARAVAYVTAAIQYAPGLGGGHGPLHHALSNDGKGGFVPVGGEE